jgi:UDP-N-acetylglucosamine 2-epimerase (non-hydrolysing)
MRLMFGEQAEAQAPVLLAELPVVLPLHPRTRARIAEQGLEPLLEPLTLSEPLGFLAMVLLEFQRPWW